MRRARVLVPVDLPSFGDGQAFQAPGYLSGRAGDVVYRGDRPSECLVCGCSDADGTLAFHAHGFLARDFITVRLGQFVKIWLKKSRWRCVGCGRTSHSRPPDELPRVKASTLCVVVFLYAVLVFAGLGWAMGLPVLDAGRISARTIVRWRQRALALAAQTEEALRKAVEERAGLEPAESHLGRGLSPPEWLLRRPWNEPCQVTGLWRGIQLLLAAHRTLGVSCAEILAQARRFTGTTFLI
jgi:heterodisulfide reductase subunit C